VERILPYELRPGVAAPEERHVNSFILLRHFFGAMDGGGQARVDVPFFTLYTNIAPMEAYATDFVPLDAMEGGPLPFYCTYHFRVHSAGGLIVYNSQNEDSGDPPLEDGAIFNLAEPERLITLCAGDPVFFLLKPRRGDNGTRFIRLGQADRNRVQVRIGRDESYAADTAIALDRPLAQSERQPIIGTDAILGRAHQPPPYINPNYDVALLFDSAEFMRGQYQEVIREFLPPGGTGGMTGNRGGTARVNMLDLQNFFRILGAEASLPEHIDGLEFIQHNYPWGEDGANVGRVLMDANPDWWEELAEDRPCGINETANTRSIRRSIVCAHPLEWDRTLYVNEGGTVRDEIRHSFGLIGASDDDDRYFAQKMEAIDIWNGGLQGQTIRGLDTSENSFWFAHPAYFINHLNQAGLLDRSFNPYEGRVIKRTWRDTTEERASVVRDNPGFAPVWEAGTPQWEGNNFGGFAVPTALFNNLQPPREGNPTPRHGGVDFRGRGPIVVGNAIQAVGGEIKSFIYGRVINTGWTTSGSFGRIMLIANERGRGIYLLAHLSGIADGIQRGSRIEPNDSVAYAGRSGDNFYETAFASHLHLEYYDVQYDSSLDTEGNANQYVVVIADNDRLNPPRTLELQRGRELPLTRRRNPFDHAEEWIQ